MTAGRRLRLCRDPWRAPRARQFVGDWKGKLICDDYAGYKALFETGITEGWTSTKLFGQTSSFSRCRGMALWLQTSWPHDIT